MTDADDFCESAGGSDFGVDKKKKKTKGSAPSNIGAAGEGTFFADGLGPGVGIDAGDLPPQYSEVVGSGSESASASASASAGAAGAGADKKEEKDGDKKKSETKRKKGKERSEEQMTADFVQMEDDISLVPKLMVGQSGTGKNLDIAMKYANMFLNDEMSEVEEQLYMDTGAVELTAAFMKRTKLDYFYTFLSMLDFIQTMIKVLEKGLKTNKIKRPVTLAALLITSKMEYWKSLPNQDYASKNSKSQNASQMKKKLKEDEKKYAADHKTKSTIGRAPYLRPTSEHQWYYFTLNVFDDHHCFDLLLSWVSDTNNVMDTLQMNHMLVMLDDLPDYTSSAFMSRFAKPIFPKMMDRLVGLTVQLNNSSRSVRAKDAPSINLLWKLASKLAPIIWDSDGQEKLDRYSFNVAATEVKSDSLEARVRGLHALCKMVERTSVSDSIFAQMLTVPDPRKEQLEPLRKEVLCGWLNDTTLGLLDILLDFSREEVIKLNTQILLFMMKNGGLKVSFLKLLWKKAAGQHESLKLAIYDSIAAFLPVLAANIPAEIVTLYNLLHDLDRKEHDISTLTLISKLLRLEYSKSNKSSHLNDEQKNALWSILLDFFSFEVDNSLEASERERLENLADKANQLICKVLEIPGSLSQKDYLISECGALIEKSRAVLRCLTLMRFLLTRVKKGRAAMAQTFMDPNGLVSKVISELSSYLGKAKSNLDAVNAKLETKLSDQSIADRVLVGNRPHRDQVNGRLAFVSDVCKTAGRGVPKDLFVKLYNDVGNKLLSPKEKGDFFDWLLILAAPNNYFVSRESVTKNAATSKQITDLFDFVDSNLTPENVTPSLFELFWRLFILTNMITGSVMVGTVPMKPNWNTFDLSVTAKNSGLKGLEKLWTFVLKCEDKTVGTRAALSLNKLFSGRGNMTVSEEHIKRCIDILRDYKNRQACIVSRCLVLIMHLVEQTQGELLKKRVVQSKQQARLQNPAPPAARPAGAAPITVPSNAPRVVFVIENPRETQRRATSVSTAKSLQNRFSKFFNKELVFEYNNHPKSHSQHPPLGFKPEFVVLGPTLTHNVKLAHLRKYLSLKLTELAKSAFSVGRTVTFNRAVSPDSIHIYLGDKELYQFDDDKLVSSLGVKDDSKLTIRVVPLDDCGPMDAVHIGTSNFIGDITPIGGTEPEPLIPAIKEGEKEEEVEDLVHYERHAESMSSPFFLDAEPNSQPLLKLLFTEESMVALQSIINDDRCSKDEEWKTVGMLCWELIQRLPCKDVKKWIALEEEWTNVGDVEGHFFPLLCDLAEIDALLHSRDTAAATACREHLIKSQNAAKVMSLLRSPFIQQNYAKSQPVQVLCALCLSIVHSLLLPEMGHCDGMKNKISFEKDAASLLQKNDTEFFFNLCNVVARSSGSHKDDDNSLLISPRNMDKNESLIIMYALDIICGLIATSEEAAHSFGELLKQDNMWLPHLLVSTSSETRPVVAESIICLRVSNPLPEIVTQISSFIPQLDSPNAQNEEFFTLMKHYIRKDILSLKDLIVLRDTIFQLMRNHQTTESFREMQPDKLLNELFDVLLVMFMKNDKTIPGHADSVQHVLDDETKKVIDFLFNHCLFVTPAEANSFLQSNQQNGNIPPRCKVSESRKKVLITLELIATQSCNPAAFEYVTKLLHTYIGSIDLSDDWRVMAPKDGKISPILGLRNLGATCYMNSIIQQLYHVKEFRNSILSMPAFDYDDDESGDLATLFQLQVLFARLKESATSYANTRDFAKTVKIYGAPVQTSNQMDANEFCGALFASLENSLAKVPGREHLLQSLFGGTTVTEFVCGVDPKHVSRNSETFTAVSVDVKNKGNLGSSLSSLIAGENLNGDNQYQCSSCNKKVDAVRRTLFKTLPQILIIHLKRFEYSVQYNAQIKLHDRCEFPMILDMDPYMLKEDAPQTEEKKDPAAAASTEESAAEDKGTTAVKQSNKYRLCGIVVHSGSASGGHYYSYHRHPNDPNKWIELNDTTVSPFDPRTIPQECFGNSLDPKASPVTKSAYLLFYERLSDDQEVEATSEASTESTPAPAATAAAAAAPAPAAAAAAAAAASEEAEAEAEVETEESFDEKAGSNDNDTSGKKNDDGTIVSAEVQQIIVQENASSRMKSYLFSLDFAAFIYDLMNKWKDSIDEDSVKSLQKDGKLDPKMVDTESLAFGLFLRVMTDVLPHGSDVSMIPQWELNIVKKLKSSPRVAGYLLNLLIRSPDFMRSILIDSPSNEARVLLVHLIILAIRVLEKKDEETVNDITKASYDDLETEAKKLSQSLQGFTKTDIWCSAKLENSLGHHACVPQFMKSAMDLWYFAASSTKAYYTQYFFTLFLEFAKLGPYERHLLCDTLAFFNKATSLLSHRLPPAPKSIPVVTASAAEVDDDPDEKDFIINSGFAELYGMKDKEKPKSSLASAGASGISYLKESDLVYLLEALTVIVQNARLPPFEAPKDKETQPKKGSKKSKPAETSQSGDAPAAAAAAAATAAADEAAAKTVAEPAVSSDQLSAVIGNVLPKMLQSDVGFYTVRQFILRLATANANVIKMLHPLFDNFLRQDGDFLCIQKYAELIVSILNVSDGAAEQRLVNYMDYHLGLIVTLVTNEGRRGASLSRALETLALIVNTGGKEVKEQYRRIVDNYFTEEFCHMCGFVSNF